MRRNKLYTVNKYNRQMFMPRSIDERHENLYGFGSAFKDAVGDIGGAFKFGGIEGLGSALGQAVGNLLGTSGNSGVPATRPADTEQQDANDTQEEKMEATATVGTGNESAYGGYIHNRYDGGGLLGGLTGGGGGGISGIGSAVGGAIGGLIGNGYQSGVGNVMSSVGKVASVIPGPWGAAISGGLQILGGGINALFGTKVDQAKLKEANEGTAKYNNFTSNAKTFDAIKGPEAQANVRDAYSGGLFARGKAARKNEELKKARIAARQWADRSVVNNIDNLVGDQQNNALANFSAYGGPIDFGSGALGLMQQNKYFETINNRTAAISKNGNNPLLQYAFGGELGTNGTDFTNGLLYIDEGGSHESNPFDGVPMGFDAEGIPNLVEEGETVYNNYVFSDRMHVPDFMLKDLGLPKSKKHISFADASKKLAKESEQRPNDPFSQAGLDASLSKLAEIQETERMRKNAKEYIEGGEFACGGKLGNKFAGPGNKPNSLKSYAYSKNWDGFKYYDPKTGEYDKGYLNFVNNINQDWLDRIFSEGQPYGSMDRYLTRNKGYALTPQQASALAQDRMYSDMHKAMAAAYEDYKAGMDPKTGKVADNTVWPDESWELDPYSEGWEERRGISTAPEDEVEDVGDMTGEKEYIPRERGEQKPYATWMRYAPVVGAGAMALTDALGLTNKPDYSGLAGLEAAAEAAGYVPEVTAEPIGDYMRYTPLDRMFHTNQLLASSRATDRALLNSSSPSKAAALLANGYNTTLALGNLAREAEEYNRGIYERTKEFNRRTNMFNSQMGLEAAMANARYRQQGLSTKLSGLAQAAAMRNDIDARAGAAKAANLSNFFTSLGNIGRENFTFNQINSDRSRRYKVKRSGQSYYDNDEEYGLGGRIKKRK